MPQAEAQSGSRLATVGGVRGAKHTLYLFLSLSCSIILLAASAHMYKWLYGFHI